jgi:transposase-like protein
MAIVTLRLAPVNAAPSARPAACQDCGSPLLQRWGCQTRRVRDPQVREVVVHRFRCSACHRTFRHSPTGVTRASFTQRGHQLLALMWTLGLSLRSVVCIAQAFALPLCHMTVARAVQQQAQLRQRDRLTGPVRVLGIDGTGARLAGRTDGVVVAVDLGRGVPVAVGVLEERDPQAVRAWLEPLVQDLGVVVVVTDDLASHAVVADALGVAHQVCQFHVRRWVGRAVRELRTTLGTEWQGVLDEVEQVIRTLPPDGGARLLALWQQIPPQRVRKGQPASALQHLKQLLLRLSQSWPRYRLAREHRQIPLTNNGCEQAIGRFKVRSRSVRGFKSMAGVAAAMLLCTRPLG